MCNVHIIGCTGAMPMTVCRHTTQQLMTNDLDMFMPVNTLHIQRYCFVLLATAFKGLKWLQNGPLAYLSPLAAIHTARAVPKGQAHAATTPLHICLLVVKCPLTRPLGNYKAQNAISQFSKQRLTDGVHAATFFKHRHHSISAPLSIQSWPTALMVQLNGQFF